MYVDFYNIIKSYISFNKGVNVIILDDPYYSELTFKGIEEKIKISKLKEDAF